MHGREGYGILDVADDLSVRKLGEEAIKPHYVRKIIRPRNLVWFDSPWLVITFCHFAESVSMAPQVQKLCGKIVTCTPRSGQKSTWSGLAKFELSRRE